MDQSPPDELTGPQLDTKIDEYKLTSLPKTNISSVSLLIFLISASMCCRWVYPLTPVPLPQFGHKLREESSATVDVTLRERNVNVSFSVEGTATHQAEVTAADCPTNRLRDGSIHSF